LDPAPSVLGDISSLTKQQIRGKIEMRRHWLHQGLKEYGDQLSDCPPQVIEDMARVNKELGNLTGSVVSDDFKTTLDSMSGPVGGDPPMPGGTKHSGSGWKAQPGVLKAGYWSEPFKKAVGETKALTSGSVVVPSLLPGIVPIPDRPTLLTQVIPSTPVEGTNLFSYLQETVRTHAAAEVAAGATKPVSTYTVQKVDDNVRTIATISQPVNRFDLEDAALLDQYIQGSLAKAVQLRLDSQILNGNGTAPNLRGLLNTAGIQSQAFSVSILQTARKALSLLYAQEIYEGIVYVMSPSQWEAVELLQLSTGAYVMQGANQGAPVDLATRRLWGQPVIMTDALSGNNALLFAPAYTHLWERSGVQVDFSEAPIGSQAGVPGFSTNEITFRAEGRWGFGCLKPVSVVSWATS
jgi:HK97 family phage major capsid protein